MKKILMALCMFMMLAASYGNASVFVTLSQQEFDDLVENSLENEPYLTVVEKTGVNRTYTYILCRDGFYFRTIQSPKKIFASSKIKVVPTEKVIADMEQQYF